MFLKVKDMNYEVISENTQKKQLISHAVLYNKISML